MTGTKVVLAACEIMLAYDLAHWEPKAENLRGEVRRRLREKEEVPGFLVRMWKEAEDQAESILAEMAFIEKARSA